MEQGQAWCIYVLRDPRFTTEIESIRYVGKTTNIYMRIYDHLKKCKKIDTHKTRWIALLCQQKLKPIMEIIEYGFGDSWKECERKWIAHYNSIGCKLVNMTNGGDGGHCHTKPKEVCEKISRSLMGHRLSQESIEKMRLKKIGVPSKRRGIPRTEEVKEKIRVANMGKPSPMKGRHHTEEAKRKNSESNKGKIAWNKGLVHTEIHRQHLRNAWVKRKLNGKTITEEIELWNKNAS